MTKASSGTWCRHIYSYVYKKVPTTFLLVFVTRNTSIVLERYLLRLLNHFRRRSQDLTNSIKLENKEGKSFVYLIKIIINAPYYISILNCNSYFRLAIETDLFVWRVLTGCAGRVRAQLPPSWLSIPFPFQ